MSDLVEKFNFNLISLVEKNPHLYDKNIADYKDKVKKENTWKSIAKQLRSTREFCEKQWASLRERFTRERRNLKAQIPSGSAGGMTKPHSAYYKALLFLEPHVRGRRNTIGNIPGCDESQSKHIPSDDEGQDEGCIETLDHDEHVLEYLNRMESKKQTPSQKQTHMYEVEESVPKILRMAEKENNVPLPLTECTNFTPKRKLKQEHGIEVALRSSKAGAAKSKIVQNEDETLQIVTDTLQSVKGLYESADKSEDVEWNFCMTIYSQLKKLSKGNRKIARTNITKIMFDLESDSD